MIFWFLGTYADACYLNYELKSINVEHCLRESMLLEGEKGVLYVLHRQIKTAEAKTKTAVNQSEMQILQFCLRND